MNVCKNCRGIIGIPPGLEIQDDIEIAEMRCSCKNPVPLLREVKSGRMVIDWQIGPDGKLLAAVNPLTSKQNE